MQCNGANDDNKNIVPYGRSFRGYRSDHMENRLFCSVPKASLIPRTRKQEISKKIDAGMTVSPGGLPTETVVEKDGIKSLHENR